MSFESRTCQNCKTQFTIAPEDFLFYEKIKVPPPTFCPECRMIRRFSFRNVRTVYKRSDITKGKEILSSFAPEKPITLYEESYWKSDEWDPMAYGQQYDFGKPFFEQFKGLLYKVPWPCAYRANSTNSDYCNNVDGVTNCFLVFNSGFSEDCYYGTDIRKSKNCLDCTNVLECELCYELVDCEKCFACVFSQDCVKCIGVAFSYNLTDCQDCFGCVNLRHKKFCIFNEQYTEQEYKEKIRALALHSYRGVELAKKKLADLKLSFPVKCSHGYGNQDVSGDYLSNCKNTRHSFYSKDLENCAYCQLLLFMPSRDSYDFAVAGGELCYEVEEGGGYNVRFSWFVLPKNLKDGNVNLMNLEYCAFCMNSSDLFGCVGLRDKQFCIFNKQYTKEEFFQLRGRIIEQMNKMPYRDARGILYRYGEFFPSELSPYAYNETIAHEFFPLRKKEASERGFLWRDPESKGYGITKRSIELADMVDEIDDSITGEVIECLHKNECNHSCTIAFKLIPKELDFYRRMKLPLPRICHNCRHYERLQLRNPLRLWLRKCHCGGAQSENGVYKNTASHVHGTTHCPNEFETTYSPDRPEIVYCEQCYQNEVV